MAARRRWMDNTPTRSGAGVAGLVGALLATGVVLVGIHLTSWLGSGHPAAASDPRLSAVTVTSTTVPSIAAGGLGAVFQSVRTALVRVRVVADDTVSYGDGVIMSPNGYVLVPASVTRGAMSISVIRSDGEELIARVVGTDPATGLTVLRVEDTEMPWLQFSTSHSEPIDSFMLVAWKDPSFGLSLGRLFSQPATTSLGNGPALLQLCPSSLHLSRAPIGTLIINSAQQISGIVVSRNGHRAVATPGWLAVRVAGDLIADGSVDHGWLGIEGRATALPVAVSSSSTAAQAGVLLRDATESAESEGVRVLRVLPESAAAKAGLEPGDVIESIDGEPVPTMADLQAVLYLMDPAASVRLDVVRGGEVSEMSVRLQAAA